MLNKQLLFPPCIDNQYKRRKIAFWAFALITLLTLIRSMIHIFSADGGAQSIATIPLDKYSPGASPTINLLFAFWGLSQLLMGFIFIVVSLRYRSLVPLMYILIFLEYGGRLLIGHWKPVATTATPPGEIGNY